mgnify:CR=1 FL=1
MDFNMDNNTDKINEYEDADNTDDANNTSDYNRSVREIWKSSQLYLFVSSILPSLLFLFTCAIREVARELFPLCSAILKSPR